MSDRILTLVLGGARSGKSAHAEALIMVEPAPWAYLATAQAFDDEMRERIALHRHQRADAWETTEVPLDLAETLAGLPLAQPVLVDCLTLWLSNLLLADRDPEAETDLLATALDRRRGPVVLVANEVGFGIVPDNALARRFRDAAGRLNQRVAATADRVVLTVAGIPVTVKG